MSELTLPGSIPGLLRRCSPAMATRLTHMGTKKGARGVIHGLRRRAVYSMAFNDFCIEPVQQSRIGLDLTDATGRAHAAWWLAEQAKNWPDEPNYTTANWRCWKRGRGSHMTALYQVWGIGQYHYWPCVYMALEHLEPSDPRLLEDGSRWVDAEALRLVVLHVAG